MDNDNRDKDPHRSHPKLPHSFSFSSLEEQLPFMTGMAGNAWAQQKERHLQAQSQQHLTDRTDDQPLRVYPSPITYSNSRLPVPRQGPTMTTAEALAPESPPDIPMQLAIPMPRPRPAGRDIIPSTSSRSFTDPSGIPPLQTSSTSANIKATDSKSSGKEKGSIFQTLKSKLSFHNIVKEGRKKNVKEIPKRTLPKKTSSRGFHTWNKLSPKKNDRMFGTYDPNSPKRGSDASAHAHHRQGMSPQPARSSQSTNTTARSAPVEPSSPFIFWAPEKVEKPEEVRREQTGFSPLESSSASGYGAPTQGMEGNMREDTNPFSAAYSSYDQPALINARQKVGGTMHEEYSPQLPPNKEMVRRKVPQLDVHPNLLFREPDPQVLEQGNMSTSRITYNSDSGRAERLSGRDSDTESQSSAYPPSRKEELESDSEPETQISLGSQYPEDVNKTDPRALFAGKTEYGGHVPTPPQPGYQRALTLEQQIAGIGSSLHHHLNSSVTRMSQLVGDGNNWVLDQMISSLDQVKDAVQHVDSLKESARTLTSNVTAYSEITSDLSRLVLELKNDLDSIREEMRRRDHEQAELIKKELGNINKRIKNISVRAYGITATPPVPAAEGLPRKQQSAVELKTRTPSQISAAAGSSDPHNETIPRVPMIPKAALRTPTEYGIGDRRGCSREARHVAWSQNLESSPTPKGISETHERGDLRAGTAQTMTVTSSAGASEENTKQSATEATPTAKKGYFGFSKHHHHHRGHNDSKVAPPPPKTAKRGIVGRNQSSLASSTTSSSLVSNTSWLQSTAPQEGAGAEGSGSGSGPGGPASPSKIHPLLRSSSQRKEMREREQLEQQRLRAARQLTRWQSRPGGLNREEATTTSSSQQSSTTPGAANTIIGMASSSTTTAAAAGMGLPRADSPILNLNPFADPIHGFPAMTTHPSVQQQMTITPSKPPEKSWLEDTDENWF